MFQFPIRYSQRLGLTQVCHNLLTYHCPPPKIWLILSVWRFHCSDTVINFETISLPFSFLHSFILISCIYAFLSIQNDNKDASTDPSFKTYTEPKASPLGRTMDSHTFDEGEGSTCSDPVPGPSGVSAKGPDLFAPVIHEDDSQEEPVLPQVVIIILN